MAGMHLLACQPGGGDTSIQTFTGRAVFQGIIFQHKKLIRNSETGYDYLFKNNRLLFSRTIDYCLPVLEFFVI